MAVLGGSNPGTTFARTAADWVGPEGQGGPKSVCHRPLPGDIPEREPRPDTHLKPLLRPAKSFARTAQRLLRKDPGRQDDLRFTLNLLVAKALDPRLKSHTPRKEKASRTLMGWPVIFWPRRTSLLARNQGTGLEASLAGNTAIENEGSSIRASN